MSNKHILQVSELTKKVRFMLESELNTVWLCGEISNFVAVSSGHWYLSLKDSNSQVKCAMFKGSNRRVRLPQGNLPRNGQQVLVRAKVSLYEPRGDFQLIIDLMEEAGEGALRQAYEQLKSTLHQQGLFDLAQKRPIPQEIKTIGLITSPTGAAIKDIITVLNRRNPSINIIIYPTLVQGETAKHNIAHAIQLANSRKECDVLIIGRGGGSLEDLWCFNEEVVVRALYACQIPTISAVGHEIDTTLADYVADLRAPTPSAAAELASSDNTETLNRIYNNQLRLQQALLAKVEAYAVRLRHLRHRLSQVHPQQKLHFQQQRADDLTMRLERIINRAMSMYSATPTQLQQRLLKVSPKSRLTQQQANVQDLTERLKQGMAKKIEQCTLRFTHNIEQLNLVSPLATIARGYAVVRNQHGNIITQTSDLAAKETIRLQLRDGEIKAIIEK